MEGVDGSEDVLHDEAFNIFVGLEPAEERCSDKPEREKETEKCRINVSTHENTWPQLLLSNADVFFFRFTVKVM